MRVLEPSRTLFIVLKTPVISKAIYLGYNKYTVPSFQQDENLAAIPQVTLESRVLVDPLPVKRPLHQLNNGYRGHVRSAFRRRENS